MKKTKVIVYGLGPIGCAIAKLILKRGFDVVGAVDIDPNKTSKDLGEIIGSEKLGVDVKQSIKEVEENADIAIVATTSKVEQIKPQLFEIISRGLNVVSTCEELVYPWVKSPEIAQEIDSYAKKYSVSVLSTGINPGFLMDFFPAVVSGVCEDINYIEAERIQDAYFRRKPFQNKIGVGLTEGEFKLKVESGLFGHVGLKESIYMLAKALGYDMEKAEETIEPVITKENIELEGLSVEAGKVIGLHQKAIGFISDKPFINLNFIAAIAKENPHDSIYINGKPEIKLNIDNGTNGDISTAAVVVNAISSVINAKEGLRTMIDICPISYRR